MNIEGNNQLPIAPDEKYAEDMKLIDREFEHPEFIRFRSLFIATQAIQAGERMIRTGIPPTIMRTNEVGYGLSSDVTEFELKVWRGFAYGAWTECKSEGLADVAQAVIRRALMQPSQLR